MFAALSGCLCGWIRNSPFARTDSALHAMLMVPSPPPTVRLWVLETAPLSQPAGFQRELRNSGPSQPVSKDWKPEKFSLRRLKRRR